MIPLNQSHTFEHYRVLTNPSGQPIILSADGSGVTYRAQDSRNDHAVILRVFSERLLSDCSVQSDFVKNARLLIELDHPSITRIIDTGQSDNQFFYVLQDPGGSTVHELVEKNGPMDVGKSLRLHGQLSEALIGLRTQPGLLSRVWPRNLIVTKSDSPGIFLVAQNLITPTDPIENAEFLAPEILAGHAETAQSTLYSIGATLYYMLTGKPPFPASTRHEDILELKSSQRVDASALPASAPIMLIKQLLEPEARNRPKSLMEWDRALQRFIRFTPDTSAITVSAEEAAPIVTPKPTVFSIPALPADPMDLSPNQPPVSAAPIPEKKEESDSELLKAKVHTQRLSLELTKRVQKELALTEQLKNLESELEKERQALRELREESPTRAKKQPIGKGDDLDAQWETLRKARKDLEREKKEFLKKTQRFSLQQLKAEAAKTSRVTSTKSDEVVLQEKDEEKVEKPRLFRFRKRSTKAAPTTAAAESQAASIPGASKDPSATAETQPVAKPNPLPKQPTANVVESAPTKPVEQSEKTVAEPNRIVTPFSVPTSKDHPKIADATPPHDSTTRRTAKPTPIPAQSSHGERDKVVSFATPFSKATPTRTTRTTGQPQPLKRTPKPNPSAPVAPLEEEFLEREVDAKVSDQETTKIETIPEMEPTRGAWSALSLLGLVIGVGLFMVYRTFFSTDSLSMLGSAHAEPLVVDYWPEDVNTAAVTMNASTPANTEDKSPSGLARVEDKLNEELRVEMRVFDNFLLLQDQEWAELLHGLKNLERQVDKYSPAELNQVRTELFEDLQRTAQLKKDPKFEEDTGYQELLAYLLSVVKPATETNASAE